MLVTEYTVSEEAEELAPRREYRAVVNERIKPHVGVENISAERIEPRDELTMPVKYGLQDLLHEFLQ